MVEKVIFENRSSDQIPIIYLGNSSVEEVSIPFDGIFTGISNVSSMLEENKFSIPNISTETIIVVDARLNLQELESIHFMILVKKSTYLLDSIDTARLYIKG